MANSPSAELIVEDWFPLFTQDEFETNLNHGWPIGINLNCPVDLRDRLSAASASVILGNQSMDAILKKYGGKNKFDPGGENRRDRKIRFESLASIKSLVQGLVEFRTKVSEEGTIGEFLSDNAIGRLPYSLSRAFAEADKGALFEALVIARMILEQVCWALKVRPLNDRDSIMAVSATKAISPISKHYPKIGRLNGWLSTHAHWGYDAHIKAAFDSPGMVMMASSKFKACAYLALMKLSTELREVLADQLKDFIEWDIVDALDLKRRSAGGVILKDEITAVADIVVQFYPDIKSIVK